MRDTMEWRKKTFIPALFPQARRWPPASVGNVVTSDSARVAPCLAVGLAREIHCMIPRTQAARGCMLQFLRKSTGRLRSHCFLCVGKDVLGRHAARLHVKGFCDCWNGYCSWMFPCPQSLHAQMLMHLHVPAVELADFWNTLCPTRWQELIQIWLGSSAFVHMSLAAVLVWGFASIAGSEGLTDWIHDMGGFVSRKVKLKADGHGGRGLFVTADVDEGETLVSVPLQAMVLGEHATNATPCAGAIRRFFDQSPDQADRGRTHALFSMMVLLLSILDGDSRAEWPHLDDLLNHWSKGQQQRFPLLWPKLGTSGD